VAPEPAKIEGAMTEVGMVTTAGVAVAPAEMVGDCTDVVAVTVTGATDT